MANDLTLHKLTTARQHWATEMVTHRKHCAQCNRAVTRRRLDWLCEYGSDVIVRLRRASRALDDYQDALDQEAAGQQLLFT